MNEELKNILYKIGMVGRIIGVGGIIIERLGLYPSREYEMEGKIDKGLPYLKSLILGGYKRVNKEDEYACKVLMHEGILTSGEKGYELTEKGKELARKLRRINLS